MYLCRFDLNRWLKTEVLLGHLAAEGIAFETDEENLQEMLPSKTVVEHSFIFFFFLKFLACKSPEEKKQEKHRELL